MRRYTRDHQVIRTWAEARGARPARVKGTQVLRLVFDRMSPNWESIGWDQFFTLFDGSGQSFLYDDSPNSRICKLTKGEQSGPIQLGS